MSDSPRDPAAEAEKMLRGITDKYLQHYKHNNMFIVSGDDVLPLLRELVELRAGYSLPSPPAEEKP